MCGSICFYTPDSQETVENLEHQADPVIEHSPLFIRSRHLIPLFFSFLLHYFSTSEVTISQLKDLGSPVTVSLLLLSEGIPQFSVVK